MPKGWRDIRSARTGKKKGELHLKMIYRPLCAAAAAAAAAVEAEEEDGGDGGKDQCECEGCYFLMTKVISVLLHSNLCLLPWSRPKVFFFTTLL